MRDLYAGNIYIPVYVYTVYAYVYGSARRAVGLRQASMEALEGRGIPRGIDSGFGFIVDGDERLRLGELKRSNDMTRRGLEGGKGRSNLHRGRI